MKITVGGETFEYDNTRRPLSEALAIEKAWGRRYAEWEAELMAGSAEATAVLVWVVYRREGRDVPLQDILDGTVDFDYAELVGSLAAAYMEAQAAEEAARQDPTSGASPLTETAGTAMTSDATPGPSRKSSASGRGKSSS